MKIISFFLVILTILIYPTYGQNSFPKLDSSALVSKNCNVKELNKPYTVVIYGGVTCGFSKYLIQNLEALDECRMSADIILIMDQPKDSVAKYMSEEIEKYPTFTNTVLKYQLKKKRDIFPQLLVFKNQAQVDHIIGIKKGMLTKTKNHILNDPQ